MHMQMHGEMRWNEMKPDGENWGRGSCGGRGSWWQRAARWWRCERTSPSRSCPPRPSARSHTFPALIISDCLLPICLASYFSSLNKEQRGRERERDSAWIELNMQSVFFFLKINYIWFVTLLHLVHDPITSWSYVICIMYIHMHAWLLT